MDKLRVGDTARPVIDPRCLVQVLKLTKDGYICAHVKGPLVEEVHAYLPEELITDEELNSV